MGGGARREARHRPGQKHKHVWEENIKMTRLFCWKDKTAPARQYVTPCTIPLPWGFGGTVGRGELNQPTAEGPQTQQSRK